MESVQKGGGEVSNNQFASVSFNLKGVSCCIFKTLWLANLLVRKQPRRSSCCSCSSCTQVPPPILSMCPFTTALQCRPIVPPELPKTPPGSWMEGGGPPPAPLTISDHLSALRPSCCEQRQSADTRQPATSSALRRLSTQPEKDFSPTFLQRPRDFYGEKIK